MTRTDELAIKREELGLSQVELARRMRTRQPVVSRLLSGDVDPQHSTEDRLAAAMGMRIERGLVPVVVMAARPQSRNVDIG